MPRYLVVDDSATIRLTLAATLRNLDPSAQIVEAAAEQEAVDRFLAADFDVVFLDMMLSRERSSLDAMRAMLAARPGARIVLTTGLDREHPDVVEAVSEGAFGHLRKPLRADAVRGVILDIEAESGRAGRIR